MSQSHPNILFLISDQQQAATITDASQCRTPETDQLRRSGVTFTSARSVSPICSPARASLMTGLLPHNHGMVDNTHCVEEFRANLRSDRQTLPQQLKEHGYRLGYFGKWHVDRAGDPGAFGFEAFETEHHTHTFTRTLTSSLAVSQNGYNERTLYGVHEEGVEQTEEHFFCSEAIEFIRNVSSDGPWCAFLSTNAPHDPYLAPKEIYDSYAPDEIELPDSFADPMDDKPNIYRRLKSVWSSLSPENYREIAACYYANCTMVDMEFGRILAELRQLNQSDNTIVVLLSDHGDLMGAHGLLCKGVPAFDEGYRVPLIISWPGHLEPGTTCETCCSTIDVAPTVLDLAGCDPMPSLDGESLVPLLAGDSEGVRRSVYAEFFGQRLSFTQRTVWKDGYKYVFNGFDYDELYDLNADPGEMINLADNPAYSERAEELAREMWLKAKASDDRSLLESEYFMYRFAPVGPERAKVASIYNRGA